MSKTGILVSINISRNKGEKKTPVGVAKLTSKGLEGDAHSGDWHRQVSLLADESIDKMRKRGAKLSHGDFAENLTTRGIELSSMRAGQKLCIGSGATLEVTQLGKECHKPCAIRKQVGDCIMPREGVFAKVLVGGTIKVGDAVFISE